MSLAPTEIIKGQWTCESKYLLKAELGNGQVSASACRGQGTSGHVSPGASRRQTGTKGVWIDPLLRPLEGVGRVLQV